MSKTLNNLWGFTHCFLSSKYFYSWLNDNLDPIEKELADNSDLFLEIIMSNAENTNEQLAIKNNLRLFFENKYDFKRYQEKAIEEQKQRMKRNFFSLVTPKNHISIANTINMNDDLSRHLTTGTPSPRPPQEAVRQYPDALGYMDDENFLFHLPHYMEAAYDDLPEDCDVAFNIIIRIDKKILSKRDCYRILNANLSENQIYEIVYFLLFTASFMKNSVPHTESALQKALNNLEISFSTLFIPKIQ